jgi:hypothetical protein
MSYLAFRRGRIAGLTVLLVTTAGCVTEPSRPLAKAVVEAKFAAVNRHAVADIVARYSAEATVTAPNFCNPRRGRADVQRTYQSLFDNYPDITVSDEEYLVQGDRVAVKYIVSSRIPGQAFEAAIMNFFTVRSGLITSDEGIFDTHGRKCSA